MSATAHQRRRRVEALQEECKKLGIKHSDFGMDEIRYRQAIEEAGKRPAPPEDTPVDAELRAKAVELGIKGAEKLSPEKLQKAVEGKLSAIAKKAEQEAAKAAKSGGSGE